MRLLFLSRWFPFPPDNGARIRIFNLLKTLAAEFEIDLVSFVEAPPTPERLAELGKICRRIEVVAYRPFNGRSPRALAGFFSPLPRSVIDTYSPEMANCVKTVAAEGAYAGAIASEIDMVPYLQQVEAPVHLLEELELATLFEQNTQVRSPARKMRHALTWWKLSRYVNQIGHTLDGCTVVSSIEAELARRLLPPTLPLMVIPNGVDVAFYAGDYGSPESDTLIYTGALTYQANFDAVQHFLAEIYPLIQQQRPAVKFFVTGKLDGVALDRLPQRRGVEFTGYLEDIRPRLARSWVNVIPLRLGGGTRLKALESLAIGTPVVSTSKGAEGLELAPGKDLLLADRPADFARVVVNLLGDAALRARLSEHGRQTVRAHYDWAQIGGRLNAFLHTLLAKNG